MDDAFSDDSFRELGHRLIDQLADFLAESREGAMPVRSTQTPEESFQYWNQLLHGATPVETLFSETLKHTFQCQHPNNLGHQVGPTLPAAALADLVGSVLDIGNGVYEVGNPATPMERVVLGELTRCLGLPETADGVLTSGGSLGNLTALLAMRQSTRQEGPHTILVSSEAHYCVTRAAWIMGMGEDGTRVVPVDSDYRMSLDELERTYEEACEANLNVIGVVGSACSTATGTFDPLSALAAFCRDKDIWFHVDAAHGGAFALSDSTRPLLEGIEMADSIVVDFHKMLLSPSLLTAVLFRREEASYQAFAQKADYLWRKDEDHEWWDAAKRTLECTRPMLGLRAYVLWKAGKDGLFARYIERQMKLTRTFARLIEEADDFELLIKPESNIICYRYFPSASLSGKELDKLNSGIREQIVNDCEFYIVRVEKDGAVYLRSALMSPTATEESIVLLMEAIRNAAKRILASA